MRYSVNQLLSYLINGGYCRCQYALILHNIVHIMSERITYLILLKVLHAQDITWYGD